MGKNTLDYKKIDNLVEKAKQNDEQAYLELYNLTYRKVYQIACSFFKNHHEVEDVTQEIYIKIFASLKHLENNITFILWMNQIAYTTCVSLFRQKSQRELQYEQEPEPMDKEQDIPYEHALNKSRKEVIADALWKLDTESRLILTLRYIEGFKVREIAMIMGIAEGTVKSRINRSKKKMKVLLSTHRNKDLLFSVFLFPSLFRFYIRGGVGRGAFVANGMEGGTAMLSVATTSTAAVVTGVVGSAILVGAIAVVPTPSFAFVKIEDQVISSQSVMILADIESVGELERVYAVSEQGRVYDFEVQNDLYETSVSENGVYTLYAVEKNGELGEKKVVIDSIDKEGPVVETGQYDGRQIKFVVKDERSRVDYTTIVAQGISGKLYYPSVLDVVNDTVIFEKIEEPFMLNLKDEFRNESEYEMIPYQERIVK